MNGSGGAPRIAVTLEQCWHAVPGGTATSALRSIEALQAHADVELVGVSARHREPPAPDFRPTIDVRALPLPRLALYESWHRLRWPAVQRATGPIDVIHVTGMAMPPKSAPMVVTVHDLAFVHDPSQFTSRGISFFHRAIELAKRDADIVIAPSQATLDDCIAYGFDADRLRLVPWSVDARRASDEDIERVRRAFSIDGPYLFWNGTIEPRKNLQTVLDASARSEHVRNGDVELVIAGPEGWNDELERLGDRLGAHVRRVGFVSRRDLAALHAGAIAFCFPSLREGFGMPVLEAMVQGTPAITSRGTATAEVVGPDGGAGLLVDPLDVSAVAAAIDAVAGDPAVRARMSAAALARAAAYSAERCASDLVNAYRDALGS